MMNKELHSPHIKVLAERLMTDIRQRGLSVGDRYLTTDEVSQSLGIGKGAAGKAMRHLAERQILISRQRSGTFVGPGMATHKQSQVRSVCVLLPAGDSSASHWAYQPFIEGIRSAMPHIMVQFAFVPDNDPLPYVQELIDTSRASGQFAGVVSVSCPAEVYRYLAKLNVPAVVYGSLYSANLPLASIDSDNFECGRLLTQYLIDRGHRHMALLMTGGYAGDNLFYDGISAALSAAGLPHSALVLRLIHNDIEGLRTITGELLQEPNRPTAIITRGTYPADAIASVATSLGLSVPDDLEIVFDHSHETTPSIDTALYPRVEPTLSFVEIAETIGKTLKEMSEGHFSQPRRILMPVELHQAERNSTKSGANGN